MNDFLLAKHSYNAGDLITVLPGLRQLSQTSGKRVKLYQRLNLAAHYYDGQINSTVNGKGESVCMNEELFYLVKPLVESQDYIESFEIWQGEKVNFDFDATRENTSIPIQNGMLLTYPEIVFPQAATDFSIPWLTVPSQSVKKQYYSDKIIVNRTQRYTNPYITYYFLKEYGDKVLFSGTEAEHLHFCDSWSLNIERLHVDNFYQLAQILSWCKVGVFNQSVHFHIADGLKSSRILELCPVFPNTFVTGANGFQFYRQAALEFYVDNLMRK